MTDNRTTSDYHASSNADDRTQSPVDAASMADAMVEFNIARKSVLIYPLDHDQVKKTTRKAYATLQQLLSRQSELSLTVLKDTLLFGEKNLEAKSTALADLTAAFRKLELAAITFFRGLEEKELVSFLEWMSRDNDVQNKEDGAAHVVDEKTFSHIRTRSMDYSRLRVTEESEIHKTVQNKDGESTWQRFVSSLVDEAPDGDGLLSEVMLDPVILAGFFNKNEVDPQKAVDNYDRLIERKLEQPPDEPSEAPSADVGLHFFNQLIHELNPELRQQFLNITFQRCSQHTSEKAATQLIKGLGREVTLEMLRYAKADGKQISPSLLHLIQQIGHLPGVAMSDRPNEGAPDAHVSAENVQKLFNREAYEHYVDGDYDQILKNASIGYGEFPDLDGLVLDLESGLEDREVQCHAARALLRLMAVSGDAADYRDWARQLTLVIPELVELHAYSCLSDIWDFAQEEHLRQQEQEQFKVAGLVLKSFLQPRFVSGLVASVEKADATCMAEAMELFPRLGEPVVVEILDSMDGSESSEAEQAKLRLLNPVGAMAAIEAVQRLNDDRPQYVCLMLRVIRRFGDAQTADTVRLLLDHENEQIAQEALSTLAKHGNAWGVLRLREAAGAAWSDNAAKAIDIAGTFRVKEMVPLLVSFVNKRGGLNSDNDRRHAALKALGQIGDPSCVQDLVRFAKKKKAFGAKTLSLLKKTLFENLDGFAFKDVETLVHLGLKLKDPEIESVCRRLLKAQYDKSRLASKRESG